MFYYKVSKKMIKFEIDKRLKKIVNGICDFFNQNWEKWIFRTLFKILKNGNIIQDARMLLNPW